MKLEGFDPRIWARSRESDRAEQKTTEASAVEQSGEAGTDDQHRLVFVD